jgi:hypothetical protein
MVEDSPFYVEYLVGVAPFFPEPEKSDLIADALRAAAAVRNATFTRSNYSRFYEIADAVPLALSLAQNRLLLLFLEILHLIESHRREEFLYDLAGIAPIVVQLGGAEAGRRLAEDISLVAGWWP